MNCLRHGNLGTDRLNKGSRKCSPRCVIRARPRGETSDSESRHELQILDLKASTGPKSQISFEGEGGERGGYSRGTGHTGNSDQLSFQVWGHMGGPHFEDFSRRFYVLIKLDVAKLI